MGPRSVERGKERRTVYHPLGKEASMGPRSVERGKTPPRSVPISTKRLQWGRVLLNAESGIVSQSTGSLSGFNGAAFC